MLHRAATVDFWWARPPQWWPLPQCTAKAAANFLFCKIHTRPPRSLGSLRPSCLPVPWQCWYMNGFPVQWCKQFDIHGLKISAVSCFFVQNSALNIKLQECYYFYSIYDQENKRPPNYSWIRYVPNSSHKSSWLTVQKNKNASINRFHPILHHSPNNPTKTVNPYSQGTQHHVGF